MPTASDLVRLRKKYSNDDVEIIAVYSDRGGRESLKRHVKREGIQYPVIWDHEDRIGKAYGISEGARRYPATPTLLIGRDGKVLWEKTRLYHWPKSIVELEKRIDSKVEATK